LFVKFDKWRRKSIRLLQSNFSKSPRYILLERGETKRYEILNT